MLLHRKNLNGFFKLPCKLDVCQGYPECSKEGRHGMCEVSDEGHPKCVCQEGWKGEFCDEKEKNWIQAVTRNTSVL